VNPAHFALTPIVLTVDIVNHILHSGICPTPCLHCAEFPGLLVALPQYGHMVLPFDFSSSSIFLLLIVHLPFYGVAIRLHGIMSNQNGPFYDRSGCQGQNYDELPLAFVPCPVLSGLVVISNHQPVLIYSNFPVCGFTPCCVLWDPVLALGVEVPRKCCATSPLPDDSLPIQSPRKSRSCLPCSVILNVYHPDYFISPLFDGNMDYIVPDILAQVVLFVHFKTTSLAHLHLRALSLLNVV
jgi:hypothetical protein